MLLTIISFLVILLVLVLTHELGHFLFAKWKGVKVEEFAFGFPPRIAGFRKGETRYSFNLLPLGGFVKIQGEDGPPAGLSADKAGEAEEKLEDPRSFSSQSFVTKILIVIAGVLFNFLLAYLLFTSGFIIGTPVALSDEDINAFSTVRITEVQKDSPAALAGLEAGDILITLESEREKLEVHKIKEVQEFIAKNKGKNLKLRLERQGEVIDKITSIRTEAKAGEGALGIAMVRVGIEKSNIFQALLKGAKTTINLTIFTSKALLAFFGELFRGQASFENVSGPVGIVSLVGDFSRFGLLFLIQLTAILSINLALINLIPFPGLDGGRAFLLALEKVKGSPFHWKFTRIFHALGFILLLALMIVITYHDIVKFNS